MLTGKGMVPESGLEQRRTSVCLGEDVGSDRGEKRHGPDDRGRFVHLPDIELRRRPGKGLIACTSKFETSQRCSDMWCRNLDGTRSRMHVVQRSDGSPDYGVLECDGRDSAAAFNLIGMGEMQRVYGEGVWRKVDWAERARASERDWHTASLQPTADYRGVERLVGPAVHASWMSHSLEPRRTGSHRFERRTPACTSSANLYTRPQSSDTLAVYEDFTLEWNPACVTIDSSTVDLYLSVEEPSGWFAVHEWTNVQYAAGKLDTQFKPGWWNASTGAGQVSAQLSFVPSGQPRWNTPAPAGPVFAIAYNGSYPSVTQSAASSNYTGPSVESVADPATKSSSPSGGKLGAAIAVPLLVVALAVAGYVTWHKLRKRPEKKRFSAVVDHRMSMISQGTWQPRSSMAGSRPGSFHPSHRPSGSQYTAANRQSYFADPNARHSTYSFAGSGVGVPSPLGAGIRQPPPAEMRQTGSGERMSRVSFAAGEALGRPSFTSNVRPNSVNTRSSLHQSQLRNSTFFSGPTDVPLPPSPGHSPQLSRSVGPTFGSSPSIPRSPSSSVSLAVTAPEGDYFSRSGTREELASIRSPSNSSSLAALAAFSKPVKPFGHAHKTSVASSLRNELSGMPAAAIVRDGRLAYSQPPSASGRSSHVSPSGEQTLSAGLPPPALSSPSLPDPKPSPRLDTTDSMPRAFHDSHRSSQILSPDEALASYARDATSPTPGQARGAAKGGLGGFLGGWRRGGMMRSLTGGSIASVLKSGVGRRGATEVVREEDEDAQQEEKRERAKSPFEDPEEVTEKAEGVHAGLELELGESVGYAEGLERRDRDEKEQRDEVVDEKSGHAL